MSKLEKVIVGLIIVLNAFLVSYICLHFGAFFAALAWYCILALTMGILTGVIGIVVLILSALGVTFKIAWRFWVCLLMVITICVLPIIIL